MRRTPAIDALHNVITHTLPRLSSDQREALLGRVRLAHSLFTGHACDSTCNSDSLGTLAALALDLPDLYGLSVLWLALAARLPATTQLEDLRWWADVDAERAIRELADEVEDLVLAPVVHDLTIVPPGRLLVDVTHTVLDPWYLTGIQRVVRGFVEAAAHETELQLVRVEETGRLVAVDADAYQARLLQGRRRSAPATARLDERLVQRGIEVLLLARRPFVERMQRDRRFATHPIVSAGRRSIRWLYRRELGLEAVPRQSLVVPRDGTLLMIEVRTEEQGVETMLRLRQQLLSRLALVIHDAIPLTHPHYYAQAHLAGYVRYTRLAAAADLLLPVSETSAVAARALRALHNSPTDAVQVCALPAAGMAPVGDGERDRLSIDGSMPLLLCVSSLEPRKNHVKLLRAALSLHRGGIRFRLVLVAGSSWLCDRVERELAAVRAHGLDVEVRREVDDGELSALYTQARAAVFVSEVEGFGLPIVEAIAHGTPVVCSDTGSMSELAADGGCLPVPFQDEGAIADALQAVLTDDHLHRRLVREARRRPSRNWGDYARDVRRHVLPAAMSADKTNRDGAAT
jgi:glycosyltransferase involved in cell wall biosynthesis